MQNIFFNLWFYHRDLYSNFLMIFHNYYHNYYYNYYHNSPTNNYENIFINIFHKGFPGILSENLNLKKGYTILGIN